MESIPVKINGGYDGLMRFEGDVLLIEFKHWDIRNWNPFMSKVRSVEISLDDLDSVRFKKNLFGARMTVRGKRLRVTESVPGTLKGEVKLQVSRSERTSAERLYATLSLRLSEHRLDNMDGDDASDAFPSFS